MNRSERVSTFPQHVTFQLPLPMAQKQFTRDFWTPITYLVGPNGSGKSRFAEELRRALGLGNACRILGASRLEGLSAADGSHYTTGRFAQGFADSEFGRLKGHASAHGFGGDAFILLHERATLRVRVEATLSQMFSRDIRLEWSSGRMIPRATYRSSPTTYKLHQDECHGLKELVVLLTHLYCTDYRWLIIDEPELHLHPQYQAYVLSEIRKVAGDPSVSERKAVVLITHSPFMLELRTPQDLRGVICFSGRPAAVPKHLHEDEDVGRFASLLPRLNTHHKQFFFATRPVFVEGVFDQRFFAALQEARNVSMAGAGSGFIDVGGKDELGHFHRLLAALGKEASYILDLDALFTGKLRRDLGNNEAVKELMVARGLGDKFTKYVDELGTALDAMVDAVEGAADSGSADIQTLAQALGEAKSDRPVAAKRVIALIALSAIRGELATLAPESRLRDCEARLSQVLSLLSEQDVHILRRGQLENYLPSYTANRYHVSDASKREAVEQEVETLAARPWTEEELERRYGDLLGVLSALPGLVAVDVAAAVKRTIGDVVHAIQRAVASGIIRNAKEVPTVLGDLWKSVSDLASVRSLQLDGEAGATPQRFSCVLAIEDFGTGRYELTFNERTASGTWSSLELVAPVPVE